MSTNLRGFQMKIIAPSKSQICGREKLEGGDVGGYTSEGVLEGDQAGAQPAENC